VNKSITSSSTGLRNVCTFPAKTRSNVANITPRGELGVNHRKEFDLHKAYVFTFIVIFLCASQNVSSENDTHCSLLFNFANSIQPNNKKSVKFSSVWSEMKKSCDHNSYEPGKTLCSWMLNNYSGEYMEANVASVMSCLGSPNYLKAKNSMLSNASGSLVVLDIDGVNESISIELEYSVRQTIESSITITVERD
jgi:hypothetical protein